MQHRQQLVFEVFLPIFEPFAPAFELVRKACGNGSVVEEHLVNDAVGIARGVEVRLEVRYVVEIPYLHPVEKGLDLAARKLGILEHGDADIGAKGQHLERIGNSGDLFMYMQSIFTWSVPQSPR